MTDRNNKRQLFVYDEAYGVWHREDEIDVKEFAAHNCNLYFIAEKNGERRLYLADSVNKYGNFSGELTGYEEETEVPWYVETGIWGLELAEKKYYSGVNIRLTGEAGACIKIYFQFNSNGEWLKKGEYTIEKTGSVNLSFQTPRCDHLKLKIEGTGNVKIFSISRKTELGSEK